MSKINLVFLPEYKSAFIANYIEAEILEHFNLLCYDSSKTYDPKSNIFLTHLKADLSLSSHLHEQGFKLASEEIWEYPIEHPQWHTIKSLRWFWINECFWYHQLGYTDYEIKKTFRKLAFMPVGRRKEFRDRIIKRFQPYLDDFIWSYDVKTLSGHSLPGDCDHASLPGITWQRYFNSQWYNDTHFSMVVETMTDGLFITEKTFKPLAFKHPFMVLGCAHTLSHLRSWGFETYGNLFDESYDTHEIFDHRMDIVENNIKNYEKNFYDRMTLDKIKHNHARFFNKGLAKQILYTDVIEPLLDYADI